MFFSSYGRYLRGSDSDEEDSKPKFNTSSSKENGDPVKKSRLSELLDSEDGESLKDTDPHVGAGLIRRLGKMEKPEGMCIECEDTTATILCEQCNDQYCSLCFAAQHKKGKRQQHVAKKLAGSETPSSASPSPVPLKSEGQAELEPSSDAPSLSLNLGDAASNVAERAQFIPVRLNLEERKELRLLEAALRVSEYTDKVDIISYSSSKSKRAHAQIREMCAILSGLVVASDYAAGQALLKDRNFKDNASFFQKVFEVGRRHKIMNPEKMRTEYGKLVFLLQDSNSPSVQDLLEFSCVKPVVTVASFLEERGGSAVLADPNIANATREVVASPGASRAAVQKDIREAAVEAIARKHASATLTADQIRARHQK